MISGTCLCGAVRYATEESPRDLTHCHCTSCRKHHGAPFATFVAVSKHAFHWVSGEDSVLQYTSAANDRCFCEICGSVVPTRADEHMLLPAGNLLEGFEPVSGKHVFVGSKAPWHIIADDLPKFEGEVAGWSHEELRPTVPALHDATYGSCLCGEVSFSVSGAPSRWLQCHCSRCRRGRSAVHGSNMFYPAAQFSWLTGRELVRKYKPPQAERFTIAFCTGCGGSTPVERDNVPFVVVPASLLDTDPGSRPEAHIHVASKAPWYTFNDGLPQFAELPPG